MLDIFYTQKFEKSLKFLPTNIKKKVIAKTLIFRDNPYQPSLKTHKLLGEHAGFYAFSVNHSYRIIFKFEASNHASFINVGTHGIYK